jgi:hypothetical protein
MDWDYDTKISVVLVRVRPCIAIRLIEGVVGNIKGA